MSEPLQERTEEVWITYLNRFEEHIYPIFAQKGFTRDTALIVWQLAQIEMSVDGVKEQLTGEQGF
jgi:hypothetical protein